MTNSLMPGPCSSCSATTAFFGVSSLRRRRSWRALRSFSNFLRSAGLRFLRCAKILRILAPMPPSAVFSSPESAIAMLSSGSRSIGSDLGCCTMGWATGGGCCWTGFAGDCSCCCWLPFEGTKCWLYCCWTRCWVWF
uniref:(northern house mosquito) hypothetical protein n=1 Tax=Culex pipiens TaxID=7175 RepID=A0A8D8DJ09_CULPI